MTFKVIKIPNSKSRNEILKWLNDEVGVMHWKWINSDFAIVPYWNTIQFKFILRWL